MYIGNRSRGLKSKTVLVYIFLTVSFLIYSGDNQNQAAESGLEAETSNLVAHWSFDEDEGDVFQDYSGKAASGTLYGVSRSTGIRNGALSFDGIDDYAQVPDNSSPPPQVLSALGEGSISLWFKVNRIPTDFGIMPILYYGGRDSCVSMHDGANQGLIVELGHSPIHEQSKSLFFTIWANGCDFPSFCFDSRYPITEKEWHHFVVVVGEDYNTGYLDGEEMTDRKYNFGGKKHSQFFENAVRHETLWIGRGFWDATPMYFDGMIDDIRIYSKPLSSKEVKDLYNTR